MFEAAPKLNLTNLSPLPRRKRRNLATEHIHSSRIVRQGNTQMDAPVQVVPSTRARVFADIKVVI
jgi:hypothetical protein